MSERELTISSFEVQILHFLDHPVMLTCDTVQWVPNEHRRLQSCG